MPADAPHVLVLGGGFGGLSAANEIRSRFPPSRVRITVVDRKDWFMVGFAKLWIMRGVRTFEDSAGSLNGLPKKGIGFVKEEVTGIDPGARQVRTPTRVLSYDFLIIAMGASLAPERIPGLGEFGMILYDHSQLPEIRRRLRGMKSGRIAISVMGMPYKCPQAPFEAALLIDSMLREEGTRDSIRIDFYSPAPITLPAAGPEVSRRVRGMLEDEGIAFHGSCRARRVERNRLVFEDGAADFDLLLAVPPHVAPAVIYESGLAEEGGFIPISRDCRTRFEGVYAVGDVTSLPAGRQAAVPKAGVFAEGEAAAVARSIVSRISSRDDRVPFDGKGSCFLESGRGTAAMVRVDMFSEGGPSTRLTSSTAQHLSEKLEFERERLERWL